MASNEAERTLDERALAELLTEQGGWAREGGRITKTFELKGFKSAVHFVNAVADAANAANHHPDIHLERYRRVRIVLTTHAIGGLSDADVALARRIDEIAGSSVRPAAGA